MYEDCIEFSWFFFGLLDDELYFFIVDEGMKFFSYGEEIRRKESYRFVFVFGYSVLKSDCKYVGVCFFFRWGSDDVLFL